VNTQNQTQADSLDPSELSRGVKRHRTRALLTAGLVAAGGLVTLLAAACGSSSPAPTPTAAAPASQPSVSVAAATTAPVKLDVYMTIVTGGMINKKDWPAVVPSALSLPANATVTVHVLNFDGADDMSAAGLVQYTNTTGTVGNKVTVQAVSSDDPNKLGTAQDFSQLDPKTGVSHTITIPQLGLNVPIAPNAWTTFTIQTGAAGTYVWKCMVPCGTGTTGLEGAMAADGYMMGKLTIS